ncbi:MAG: hypothetical protein Kow0069_15110 [Promethearchaeota archaeon]
MTEQAATPNPRVFSAFRFECLACGAEVDEGDVRFVRSKAYSRRHRHGSASKVATGAESDVVEISACPECGVRKGFLVEHVGEPLRSVVNAPPDAGEGEQPVVVDLFSGCGGLSEGFREAGFRVAAAVDVNPHMTRTFALNHPSCRVIAGDLRKLTTREVLGDEVGPRDVAAVVGGPPCQGFSTVGDRFAEDPRNRLFFEFLRVVREVDPPMFVAENVPGMLSMESGGVAAKVAEEFEQLGYAVAVRELNAVEYGVPQERRRVFFVGNKLGLPAESAFPEPTRAAPPACSKPKNGARANERVVLPLTSLLAGRPARTAAGGAGSDGRGTNCRAGTAQPGLQPAVTVAEAIDDLPPLNRGGDPGGFATGYSGPPRTEYQRAMRGDCQVLFNHERPNHSPLVLKRIKALREGQNHRDLPAHLKLSSGYPNIYGRLWRDRPATTVTGNYGCVSAPGRFIHPTVDRALTVREGARLQSFPDDFVVVGSKSLQYRQVGNAVPPLLAKALAARLLKLLKQTLMPRTTGERRDGSL